jgi:hypothetical protein
VLPGINSHLQADLLTVGSVVRFLVDPEVTGHQQYVMCTVAYMVQALCYKPEAREFDYSR